MSKHDVNLGIQTKESLILMIKRLKREKEYYKSRIEKVLEFIGNPLDNYWEEEAQYIVNILKGE